MKPKIYCALCVALITFIVLWIIIVLCTLFIAAPLPPWMWPMFLGCSLMILTLGPAVSYLAHNFVPQTEEKLPGLTISQIRVKTHPNFNGSFMGVCDVNPPLALVCVQDYSHFIKKGEIVHIDVFESGEPSDAVHIVEKGLWVAPEYFQIVEPSEIKKA